MGRGLILKRNPKKPFLSMPCGKDKVSGISSGFPELSQSSRQITHVLLTRSPLTFAKSRSFRLGSLDLHVLGTPPAFVLSQDQTLQLNSSP